MVPPCEWKGQHSDILRHVIMSHPDILLRGSEHVSARGACDPVEPCIFCFIAAVPLIPQIIRIDTILSPVL
jgi:hypothetical protein